MKCLLRQCEDHRLDRKHLRKCLSVVTTVTPLLRWCVQGMRGTSWLAKLNVKVNSGFNWEVLPQWIRYSTVEKDTRSQPRVSTVRHKCVHARVPTPTPTFNISQIWRCGSVLTSVATTNSQVKIMLSTWKPSANIMDSLTKFHGISILNRHTLSSIK